MSRQVYCFDCGVAVDGLCLPRRRCEPCRRAAVRDAQRRYKAAHREQLREAGRAYAQQRRLERSAVCVECGGACSEGCERCLTCHTRRSEWRVVGELHGNWKGEAATYTAHHHWIKRWGTRTGACSHCGRRPDRFKDGRVGTDWANLSGEYHRDVADWIELCRSCHKRFDLGRLRLVA